MPIQASSFDTFSSLRYKENIEKMTEEEADKILDINVVTFDYRNKENGVNKRGVIAEEVYEIIPSAVTLAQVGDEMLPDSVAYPNFVPYLIKEVQMLRKEIDILKEAKNG